MFTSSSTAHVDPQAGSFATVSAADTALASVKSQGLGWLAAAKQISSEGHYVAGFEIVNPDNSLIEGEWLQVSLANASFISYDLLTGTQLNGSFDQIEAEANDRTEGAYSSIAANLNPGVDLSWADNPFILLEANGTVEPGWDAPSNYSTLGSTIDLDIIDVGNTETYTQAGIAVAVDDALIVSDASSGTLTGATVTISTGFMAGDRLGFANETGITGSYNASTGVLTFSGSATLEAYQTELKSVTFRSTAANPAAAGANSTRTVSWVASSGATNSVPVTSTVDVIDLPVMGGAGNTAVYAQAGATLAVNSALTVADPSSVTLTGATVAISAGFMAGDQLSFTARTGIIGSYNAATGVLSLSGTASLATYQALLNSVTYSSTSPDPNNSGLDPTRTIAWTVSSGTANSAPVSSTIGVTPALTYADAKQTAEAASQAPLVLPAYTGSATDLSYLKSYVLNAVEQLYGVSASVFDTATLYSTSLLRDFVNRAIYDNANAPSNGISAGPSDHIGRRWRPVPLSGICRLRLCCVADVRGLRSVRLRRHPHRHAGRGIYGDGMLSRSQSIPPTVMSPPRFIAPISARASSRMPRSILPSRTATAISYHTKTSSATWPPDKPSLRIRSQSTPINTRDRSTKLCPRPCGIGF